MLEAIDTKSFEREITSPERLFSRSPFAVVTLVVRIKGYVSECMLRDAVTKAQQRHALLRVRVKDEPNHSMQFTSEGVQEIPIEVATRNSENDWIAVHSEALKIPYEFDIRPAIRFILLQSTEVCDLIILCHHLICDGMSLAYLARDLLVYLGDPSLQVADLPVPIPIIQDNLPGELSQSGIARFFINRMNRQWADQGEYFDNEDYVVLSKAYWDNFDHKIICSELSEQETTALISRCKQENVTVNSALTIAFGGAQSFVEGEKPYHSTYVIAANLRDRLPNSPGEGMGMYAWGVELDFKYNQKNSIWENARNFQEKTRPKFTNKSLFGDVLNMLYLDPTIVEGMNFKKLGGLVPPDSARYEKLSRFSQKNDVVLRLLQRDKQESLERKFLGTAVTNLGRLDFPKSYGELELDRLILQPGGGFPLANANLVLGVVTCSGKLSLVVEYAEQAVDPDTMERIKDKAMAYLLGD